MGDEIEFSFRHGLEVRMTTKKQQRTKDDEAQSKRFIDAAREAEADETEEGADRAFKKVAPRKVESKRNS